jgi:pyruvate dehydrogenase E1 component alpha subunit
MSDPGTTYRTREEVQRMRSTQDPIRGLQRYIEEWGLASEQELKVRLRSARCCILRSRVFILSANRQRC